MDTTETTLVEFCAGYGGIGLGLKRVIKNLRTIALCEIESFAIENLIAKMESGRVEACPIWNDIKTFPSKEFHGLVDILSAGFPCQPFSNAGLRRADDDPRHLFPYIMQAIEQMQPRFVLLENVEGIVSAKLGSDCWSDPVGTPVLLHVCRELERRGYKATWGVFSASETGAPHQRKRIFILGYREHDGLYGMQNDGGCDKTSEWSKEGENEAFQFKGTGGCENSGDLQTSKLANGSSEGLQGLWECSRQEGREASFRHTGSSGDIWPSRPDEQQYWWEPPRTTTGEVESKVGRDSNGIASGMDYAELCESCDNRVDELRLLGNGVVPATAAKAWTILYKRLSGGM